MTGKLGQGGSVMITKYALKEATSVPAGGDVLTDSTSRLVPHTDGPALLNITPYNSDCSGLHRFFIKVLQADNHCDDEASE
jgi:hypothetical protein